MDVLLIVRLGRRRLELATVMWDTISTAKNHQNIVIAMFRIPQSWLRIKVYVGYIRLSTTQRPIPRKSPFISYCPNDARRMQEMRQEKSARLLIVEHTVKN